MSYGNDSRQNGPPPEALALLASKVASTEVKRRLMEQAAAHAHSSPAPPTAAPRAARALNADAAYAVKLAVLALPADNLTRQRGMAEGWLLLIEPEPPRERLRLLDKVVTVDEYETKILAALGDDQLTAKELSERSGLPVSTARRALARLVAGGYLLTRGRGTPHEPTRYRKA